MSSVAVRHRSNRGSSAGRCGCMAPPAAAAADAHADRSISFTCGLASGESSAM